MMPTADPSPPLRVLMLENDEGDAELVAHEVRRFQPNSQLSLASNHKQFTAMLAAHEYDIVLADYRLPNWTGMEALRELRRLGFGIPLIVVSGTLGEERAVECVKFGAADYVLKGNLSRLPIAIRRAIDEKRARDESHKAQQLMQKAQEEAQEREERFRQLAENIDEVFFISDAQYRETLYINPAYEKIWGRSCQSLYDNPASFMDPLPSEDRIRLQEYVGRIQRGETPGKLEHRVIHQDGSVRWVISHAVPIFNEHGEVYRISGVALDITESRKAQLALEESVERFRMLTDASFDAISVAQDGRIHEVNQGFLQIFGYDRVEEVVSRHITDFYAEESRAEAERRIATNAEESYEFVGERKDGKKILIEATARMHFTNGKASRITALRDVTERRALENQFRQAQKMEAVGLLAGGISHDYNNLLGVILGNADLLLETTPTGVQQRYAEQIKKASLRAAALTQQLLAFSRNQIRYPAILDLNAVVRDVGKILQRLIGEDVQIVTDLEPSLDSTLADRGQIEQILMNLA
ncbi:MAG: PAS domain S-box protein, partial [Gemmatimonadaceae bacterium]